jgi:hypothetical protein
MVVRVDLMRRKTYVVGRFRAEGPVGYRAWSDPGAPLRATREEAAADQQAWWDARQRAQIGDGEQG